MSLEEVRVCCKGEGGLPSLGEGGLLQLGEGGGMLEGKKGPIAGYAAREKRGMLAWRSGAYCLWMKWGVCCQGKRGLMQPGEGGGVWCHGEGGLLQLGGEVEGMLPGRRGPTAVGRREVCWQGEVGPTASG